MLCDGPVEIAHNSNKISPTAMTEDLLLAPPNATQGGCLAQTNPSGANRGAHRADPVIPFPKDNEDCALLVQPGHLLR